MRLGRGVVNTRWMVAALFLGCARIPTPLEPNASGSIGLPHHGVLKDGQTLPQSGDGFRFLRDNGRRSALPRFADAIGRAALTVKNARTESVLTIGDLSAPTGGGPALPHLSHRSGRDADLLLYLTTLDGVPVRSPGFVKIGADGLGEDGGTFYRFDVEREWLLIRTLLTDESARVQWVFVHDDLKAILLEWAQARGESVDLVWRAAQVMAQPKPGGLHDDHIHVRTACNADELARGCEAFGPARPWLIVPPPTATETNAELAQYIIAPLTPAAIALKNADPR